MVSAKVIAVYHHGIFVEFEGQKGFLSKENLYISKKKKLTEVFSVGYQLSAKIFSKKPDYYVLSQKDFQLEDKKVVAKKQPIKAQKKPKKNNNPKATLNQVPPKLNAEISKTAAEKTIHSIADLKKLKQIGGIKISLSKTKKTTSSQKESVEKKELPKLPENFLKNLEASYRLNVTRYETIVKKLKDKGLIDET